MTGGPAGAHPAKRTGAGDRLPRTPDGMAAPGRSPEQAMAALERQLGRQAYMLSASDLFWRAGWLFLLLTALIRLSRPVRAEAPSAAAH